MPLQALYITDEILENLKKEPNMSKVVNSLLYEYYNLTIPIDERFTKVKVELDKKMKEYQQLQELNIEQEQKKLEEQEKQDQEWEKQKIRDGLKASIRKEYDSLPDKITDITNFEEYLNKRLKELTMVENEK